MYNCVLQITVQINLKLFQFFEKRALHICIYYLSVCLTICLSIYVFVCETPTICLPALKSACLGAFSVPQGSSHKLLSPYVLRTTPGDTETCYTHKRRTVYLQHTTAHEEEITISLCGWLYSVLGVLVVVDWQD